MSKLLPCRLTRAVWPGMRNFAVVRKDTIHRLVADALAAMPDDPNIIWVTGPSKTADVEGILIQGVQGPGVQACLVV